MEPLGRSSSDLLGYCRLTPEYEPMFWPQHSNWICFNLGETLEIHAVEHSFLLDSTFELQASSNDSITTVRDVINILEATKSMLCTDHSLHNNKVTQWYNTATLSMVDSWKPQRVKSTQFPFNLPSENIITPCQNSQVLAGYDIATCMILVYSSVYTY